MPSSSSNCFEYLAPNPGTTVSTSQYKRSVPPVQTVCTAGTAGQSTSQCQNSWYNGQHERVQTQVVGWCWGVGT
eukprot:1450586-Rhodomonas_salina.1